MKKIYFFVLKSFLGPMVLTFFIALFILLMQFLWKYVDDMVGKGFEWYVLVELLFYASATFVPMALPLAVLLASLMTFGNLGEHSELVAIKAAGISFRKTMMPLVVFIILLSGCAFYFSNNVLPIANLKYGVLLFDIREKKPALNINEGVFYSELQGYVIRIGKKDRNGVDISNVMIFDHTEDMGNINATLAERGKMMTTPDKKTLTFTLYDGYNYYEPVSTRERRVNKSMQRTHFEEETRRIDLSELNMIRSKEDLFKDNYQMLNLNQLREAIDTLVGRKVRRERVMNNYIVNNFQFYNKADTSKYSVTNAPRPMKNDFISNFSKQEQVAMVDLALNKTREIYQQLDYFEKELSSKDEVIARHDIEWYRKFTLSVACLILFFIGAPLGAIIRKGGLGLPVVFSTIFFIIFHVISMTGEKFAREGVIPVYQGMWLPTLVFLPVGILLTYSASTDSRIMSLDWWSIILNRVVNTIKRALLSKKTT
ncbi:MAG TPA: LptF/LptG family permease [Bacteroidales bacterium]|nr:LptF/LptG family permease [Bacteroidales bacterium]